MSHHRNGFPFLGTCIKHVEDLFKHWKVNFCKGIPCSHGESRVIHILGGQAEMNKSGILRKPELLKFFFQEIFNGFDIMVGFLFNLLDPDHISFAELSGDLPQFRENVLADAAELGQWYFAKCDKILDLSYNTVLNDSSFRKVF